MKARTWQLLRQWTELLDMVVKDTEHLSGGFADTGSFKEAGGFYSGKSDKMRANLVVILVDRVDRCFDWALVDLLAEIHPEWVEDLPNGAAGRVEHVRHHILCHAQAEGLWVLSGPLNVGDRLIWRPLNKSSRVDVTVLGVVTNADGEAWVYLKTGNNTYPNDEEDVRESCVRALPES